MPAVFTAPIRNDIVQFVHTNMSKNRRQAHGVYKKAGHQHSAESWGTGRAVARIPRISGSGTHRSGQGAFGNMCRKGRMFAPLKVYRKWHRKINLTQKRHAVAAALAASAVTPLVLARGHRVQEVPELPLVIDSLNVEKTKNLIKTLEKFGLDEDFKRSLRSKQVRSGKGKLRNSRYVLRKGPLVIYGDENNLIKRTARNITGCDVCHVNRLNLLQLAPGGHLGRLIVWTKEAFAKLNTIFGTYRKKGIEKKGFQLGRNVMDCADLARIINSDAVQSVLREVKTAEKLHFKKKNPLTNKALMKQINPFNEKRVALVKKLDEARHKGRVARVKAKRADHKAKAMRTTRHNKMIETMQTSFFDAEEYIRKDEIANSDKV